MGTLMVLFSKVRLHMAVPMYFMLDPLALEMLIFSQYILQPSFLASFGPHREREAPESGHAINLALISPDFFASELHLPRKTLMLSRLLRVPTLHTSSGPLGVLSESGSNL